MRAADVVQRFGRKDIELPAVQHQRVCLLPVRHRIDAEHIDIRLPLDLAGVAIEELVSGTVWEETL